MTALFLVGEITKVSQFEEAARLLRDYGYVVSSPLEACRSSSWEEEVKHDLLCMLNRTQAICLLRGWNQDTGACLLVHVGRTLGMPVHNLPTWLQVAHQETSSI